MSPQNYDRALMGFLFIGFIASIGLIPFTPSFGPFASIFLALWVGLPWLLVPTRLAWRLTGFVSVALGCSMLLAVSFSTQAWAMSFLSALPLALCANWIFLNFLLSHREEKSVILAQNLCVLYVALMWAFLQRNGITSDFATPSRHVYDARFMFWPPFLAVVLWGALREVKRNATLTILLAVTLLQPAIGFVDLHRVWGVPWALGAICVCVFGSLATGIWYLRIEKLNSRGREG